MASRPGGERASLGPRNDVLFSGALALVGALTIYHQFCTRLDLLNFGVLIAFMGVNAASLVLPAVVVEPEPKPKLASILWVFAGLGYAAFRTKGFRGKLVSFEVPAAEQ